jgi:hypothetical protein
MKKYFLTIVVFCMVTTIHAQNTPESYLKRIPALPKDSCSVTLESNQMYTEKVQSLIDEIQSDIEARNENVNASVEANKDAIEANAMNQVSQMTGMSQADLNKLKNSKNMTAAEKQALANQILMQKTDMSMDEVKKLSTMSEAGKQAYMQAMGTEMMGTSGTNQQTSPAVADIQKTTDLLNQQQTLLNAYIDGQKKIGDQYAAIDNAPKAKAMLDNILKWQQKQRSFGEIVSNAQAKVIDSLEVLINAERVKYCNLQTPKYRAQLRNHLSVVKSSLPEYRKYGKVNCAYISNQTKIEQPAEMIDVPALEAIKSYLGCLKNVHKYAPLVAKNN